MTVREALLCLPEAFSLLCLRLWLAASPWHKWWPRKSTDDLGLCFLSMATESVLTSYLPPPAFVWPTQLRMFFFFTFAMSEKHPTSHISCHESHMEFKFQYPCTGNKKIGNCYYVVLRCKFHKHFEILRDKFKKIYEDFTMKMKISS